MKPQPETAYKFPGQTSFYRGKVRDVYVIGDTHLVMIASDRISAFDVVLPEPIPYKGQILTDIAAFMLRHTSDIVPNWLLDTPAPGVSVGHYCRPYKVEMVIRGYLAGHAAREYKKGKRTLCEVSLPEGMRENEAFPEPVITPATKAPDGLHDEDISAEEIIAKNIVGEEEYRMLEDYTRKLFARGTEIAARRGLILVDTKYEFGKDKQGNIRLIDEIHTPDSSRYFYSDSYDKLLAEGKPQRQLSKEFVREWLMENGFQGKSGQKVPQMTGEVVRSISARYIELYENLTGKPFIPAGTAGTDIYESVVNSLSRLE